MPERFSNLNTTFLLICINIDVALIIFVDWLQINSVEQSVCFLATLKHCSQYLSSHSLRANC